MYKHLFLFVLTLGLTGSLLAQRTSQLSAEAWADSVMKTLSKDELIAQMFIIRSSGPAVAGSPIATFYDKEVEEAIRNYNVGGICQFQGGPRQQAQRVNFFQSI